MSHVAEWEHFNAAIAELARLGRESPALAWLYDRVRAYRMTGEPLIHAHHHQRIKLRDIELRAAEQNINYGPGCKPTIERRASRLADEIKKFEARSLKT